ncbi:MAG TPA: dephospho-CoA kinase [Polyangiaceae bacterium]|nr:dephospho-CoA kinase [Polyangiaceae bacterium]
MTQVFGLTGGIGSGKSRVARRFRERGLPVIDADQLARDVVVPGSSGLAEIVAEFGAGVLDTRGELDRAALAKIVFNDEAARRRLNAITHPRVRELTALRISEHASAGALLVCYEVPLLVESGMAEALRPVVVVSAPEALQVERVMARDGASESDARARIAAQMSLAEKVKVADFVIDNRGSLAELQAQADAVLDAICARLGVDTALYPRPSG